MVYGTHIHKSCEILAQLYQVVASRVFTSFKPTSLQIRKNQEEIQQDLNILTTLKENSIEALVLQNNSSFHKVLKKNKFDYELSRNGAYVIYLQILVLGHKYFLEEVSKKKKKVLVKPKVQGLLPFPPGLCKKKYIPPPPGLTQLLS